MNAAGTEISGENLPDNLSEKVEINFEKRKGSPEPEYESLAILEHPAKRFSSNNNNLADI
jgi:hypothetical protein